MQNFRDFQLVISTLAKYSIDELKNASKMQEQNIENKHNSLYLQINQLNQLIEYNRNVKGNI